jgi:uncharacterized protein (DUF305 family)
MKTRLLLLKNRWGLAALTLVAVGGLLLLGTSAALAAGPRNGMGPGAMMGGPMGGMMTDADRHFIEMMIPHHEDAIAMADLALAQAQHPEIKALAASIKQTQTAEIVQMRAWYQAWYGTAVPVLPAGGGMMGGGMMGADDLTTLRTLTGDAFDRAFIEQMVPHHQMAVQMSNMTLPRSQHPELQGLLRSIVASQSAEITQMQQWYQTWYQTTVPTGQHGMGMMGGGPMHGPGNRPGMPAR